MCYLKDSESLWWLLCHRYCARSCILRSYHHHIVKSATRACRFHCTNSVKYNCCKTQHRENSYYRPQPTFRESFAVYPPASYSKGCSLWLMVRKLVLKSRVPGWSDGENREILRSYSSDSLPACDGRTLSIEAAKTLVQAFVSSRLDYCNAILHGLPEKLMIRLQSVQNGVITSHRYCDSSTGYQYDSVSISRLPSCLGQFKRSLKTFLFGLWDHSAL